MHSTDPKAGEGSPRRRALWFGGGSFVFFGAIAAWLLLRKHQDVAAYCVGGAGTALLGLALVSPPAVLAVRGAWMRLAAMIGWVNSRIILSLLFFLMLTPLALLAKATGRRGLDLRGFKGGLGGGNGAGTTWIDRPAEGRDPKHYEHPW